VEMDSWDAPLHGVPVQIYERMERNEPSAWEKTRTAQLVPPTERGIEDGESMDIGEILATLSQGQDVVGRPSGEFGKCDYDYDAGVEGFVNPINEVTSSGMFALDGPPDVTDLEKLQFACDTVGEETFTGQVRKSSWAGSAEVRRGQTLEPYIR